MRRTKWIFILSVPVIVLSLCMASSIHIMSKAEFPIEVVHGDKKYLNGVNIESRLHQREGVLKVNLIDGNISYKHDKNYTTNEGIEPSFYATVIGNSIKGRKKLSKEESEDISNFYSSSNEKVLECYELEEAAFKYKSEYIYLKNETFLIKSTKSFRLIEQKVQYLYDDGSERPNMTANHYFIHVDDGTVGTLLPITHAEGTLSMCDKNYLITTRLESMPTPSKLYRVEHGDDTITSIKKIANLNKDRYPFVIKEIDGNAVILSYDENKANYISIYDTNGELIKERNLNISINPSLFMLDIQNTYVNDQYLILADEDKAHIIDCDKMEVKRSYSTGILSYIEDMYYKNDLLYVLKNNFLGSNGARPNVGIKVLDGKQVVFEGDWNLLSYRKDIEENLKNNIWDYSPSMYYEIEVKR